MGEEGSKSVPSLEATPSGAPRVTNGRSDPGGPIRRRLQLTALAVLVVVLVVAVSSYSGFGVVAHWECRPTGPSWQTYTLMPASLINSPYGGEAWANASLPATFPGGPGYPTSPGNYSGGSSNGTASGVLFSVNTSVSRVGRALVTGPGSDEYCPAPYQLTPVPSAYGRGFVGVVIPLPSKLSDVGEANTMNLSGNFSGEPVEPSWDNGFHSANSLGVSTCSSAATDRYVTSFGLSVVFPQTVNTPNITVELPFLEHYHYRFPADYGTWEVDNLSADSGPGGGWAFSYSPC